MSTLTAPRTAEPGKPGDPFYYGWRDVARTTSEGKTVVDRIPLTLEDCLHPQFGDVIVEGSLHARIVAYLSSVLRARLAGDGSALVLSDTGVFWDDPELGHHCPDIAVIFGLGERRSDWSSFDVGEQGARPRLIVEVVSPNTRKNDIETKVDHYHQARVPVYVVVDRVGEQWRLIGYQWTPSEYLPMPADKEGRLWLEPVGLWLGLKENGVVLFDGKTGHPIGDYAEISAERDAEAARAEAEGQRAEAEAAARLAAEARIRELEELLRRKGD